MTTLLNPNPNTNELARDAHGFLRHLRSAAAPLVARRGVVPRFADAHAALFERDPELYALCALADQVQPAQWQRMLFVFLAAPRVGQSADLRQTLDRVTALLLTVLHPDQVISVFLALRRLRANHKHTRRAIVGYVLNHPQAEALAVRRRPALVDCLEHAVGKNVARACAKHLASASTPAATHAGDTHYVRRHLLRFAADPARAAAVVKFLYRAADSPAPDGRTSVVAVEPEPERAAAAEEPTKTVTTTNRGDIAATLVHLYRGDVNPSLQQALGRYVESAAQKLPRFDGSVAVVLDASASTRGYGEREFACVSQSQALRLVLEKCCANVRVAVAGSGAGPIPEAPLPQGETDLASALLEAVADAEGRTADVAAVISDGYENVTAGDLERVVAALPAAGVDTPVVFCHSKFTDKDDLSLRRPVSSAAAELEFARQDDFSDLLWSLFARAKGGRGLCFLRQQLRQRLALLEKEKTPWLSPPNK